MRFMRVFPVERKRLNETPQSPLTLYVSDSCDACFAARDVCAANRIPVRISKDVPKNVRWLPTFEMGGIYFTGVPTPEDLTTLDLFTAFTQEEQGVFDD